MSLDREKLKALVRHILATAPDKALGMAQLNAIL